MRKKFFLYFLLIPLIFSCVEKEYIKLDDKTSSRDGAGDRLKDPREPYSTELYHNTPQKISDSFHDKYSLALLPGLGSSNDYLGDSFAFTTTNWLLFYIRMHELTNNSIWITYLNKSINHLFDHTDSERYSRGELTLQQYTQGPEYVFQKVPFVPHLGWSNAYSSWRRAEVLTDGNICKHILLAVDYVKENDITGLESETFISKCEAILTSHDTSFFYDRYGSDPTRVIADGSYFYPSTTTIGSFFSHPIPFNHNTVTAEGFLYLYKYRGVEEYLNKAKAIRDFFLRYLETQTNNYMWAYSINRDLVKHLNEDVNHSAYNVHFLYAMWKNGYLDSIDVNKIINVIPLFLTETSCAHRIDGSDGDDDGGDWNSVTMGYLNFSTDLDREDISKTIIKSIAYKFSPVESSYHAAVYRSIAEALLADKKRLNR